MRNKCRRSLSPGEAVGGAEERRAELPREERLAVLADGVDGEPVPPQLLLHLVAPRHLCCDSSRALVRYFLPAEYE